MTSSTPDSAARRRRTLAGLVLALALAAGCVPTGERPELVGDPVEAAPDPGARPPCPEPGPPFESFGASVVVISSEHGVSQHCMLVADTTELRARGLMEVRDIGGYEGMVFAFPEDTLGGFWMGNTHIPLSIAFVASNGAVVSIHDMEPCPEAVDCATYEPDAPYRWAVEVPQGAFGGLGVGPGSLLDVESLPVAVQ